MINLYLVTFNRNDYKVAIAAQSEAQAADYARAMPSGYDGLKAIALIQPSELSQYGIDSDCVINATQLHPLQMPEKFRKLWRVV